MVIEDVKSTINKTTSEISIVYFSKTRKTQRFVEKVTKEIDIQSFKLGEYSSGKYILVTPTYFFGEVPVEVKEFLINHSDNMVAVMSAGNRNWGNNFAKSGETISKDYNVELIGKVEMMGTQSDVEVLKQFIKNKI